MKVLHFKMLFLKLNLIVCKCGSVFHVYCMHALEERGLLSAAKIVFQLHTKTLPLNV